MNDAIAMHRPSRTIGPYDAVLPAEGVFDRERPRLVAIARRILRDRDAAEDVAQEAFARFIRSHSADEPYAASWLRAAAAHGAYDVLRSERRRRARDARQYSLERSDRDAAVRAVDPVELLERNERVAVVRSALRRIGEKHAAILALRYGGLTYGEIAAALCTKITSVGTRLARAEAALVKELDNEPSWLGDFAT